MTIDENRSRKLVFGRSPVNHAKMMSGTRETLLNTTKVAKETEHKPKLSQKSAGNKLKHALFLQLSPTLPLPSMKYESAFLITQDIFEITSMSKCVLPPKPRLLCGHRPSHGTTNYAVARRSKGQHCSNLYRLNHLALNAALLLPSPTLRLGQAPRASDSLRCLTRRPEYFVPHGAPRGSPEAHLPTRLATFPTDSWHIAFRQRPLLRPRRARDACLSAGQMGPCT